MFDINQFTTLVNKANPTLSRYTKSSIDGLIAELSTIRGIPPPPTKARIQELIFHIPYDKQTKYKDALAYLARELGVVICGKPVEPKLILHEYGVTEFLYVGVKSDTSQVLNTDFPGAKKEYAYHHVFDCLWKSSTGNMESLRNVGTREHVKFNVAPGSPPFNQNLADTPIEFFHGENKTGANSGLGRDDHMSKPPSLIVQFPVQAGELVADQWYQYTIDNGMTWHNIEGAAYKIIKGVRRGSNGKWVFYFAKKNWLPHNRTNFHFEVEYEIHPPMPPPMPGAKLGKIGISTPADIHQYVSKVVRLK
ncbi:MAG: hypothetical protein JNL32_04575 [Candidatus Kapabacteria bacterium]|nr:hypothetical protein [Candidatus Kapabacteria bacterium]